MKGDDKNYYDHYFGDSIYLYAGVHRAINGHGHRDGFLLFGDLIVGGYFIYLVIKRWIRKQRRY